MIKIGNYYVKKTAFLQLHKTNKNSQNELNPTIDIRLPTKSKDESELRECDKRVQNDPQYLSQYVKDIFVDLKKNEVN